MKTIIVPVDFSKYSEYALEAAAQWARKFDAHLLVVHMLELSTVHAYGEETETDRISRALFYTKNAEKQFDSFLDKPYLKSIAITPIIRHFKVFSELGDIAENKNADLIVMGSKGSGGLSEFFIGSNTEKVVRHSNIPVLVIKNRIPNWEIKKIVFASDFSEKSVPSFQKAIRMLAPLQAELQLLHVNLPDESFMSSDELRERVSNFLMKAEGNLDRLATINYISDRSAEDGILKYAAWAKVDLIAMTTHGRTGFARFFEGSVAEKLANHGHIPLLTFKM